MKLVILFVCLVFILCQSGSDDGLKDGDASKPCNQFNLVSDSEVENCPRNYQVSCEDNKCLAKSEGCLKTQTRTRTRSKDGTCLKIDLEEEIPVITAGHKCSDDGTMEGDNFMLAIPRMVQYQNEGTECGYEHHVSKIVRWHNMSRYSWTTELRDKDENGVYEMYMKGGCSECPQVEMWVYVVEEEIEDESIEEDGNVLTPDSVKFSVNVSGIEYHGDADGFAIGVMVMSREGMRKRTQVQLRNNYRPDETNEINEVMETDGEGSFSFQKRFYCDGEKEPSEVKFGEPKEDPEQLKLQLRERLRLRERKQQMMWMSVCKQAKSIYWDPTLTTPVSSANVISIGLLLAFIVFSLF